MYENAETKIVAVQGPEVLLNIISLVSGTPASIDGSASRQPGSEHAKKADQILVKC